MYAPKLASVNSVPVPVTRFRCSFSVFYVHPNGKHALTTLVCSSVLVNRLDPAGYALWLLGRLSRLGDRVRTTLPAAPPKDHISFKEQTLYKPTRLHGLKLTTHPSNNRTKVQVASSSLKVKRRKLLNKPTRLEFKQGRQDRIKLEQCRHRRKP